ncbi:MAG: phenylacetate-CoA oxygenase/reductase subunit PaaK [Phaeodactylibacter sp.]|nr:phenylacetate-CoA oxygenase/reductase subunit PaaK [Phaeodactylibacter sp.]
MAAFYPLKVKAVDKVTSDCSVITFEVSEELAEAFNFKQGQHLTLKAQINEEEVRRSYSLCSSPLEKEWKVAVKKVEDGRFSTYANDALKVGDTVEVMPPSGRFYVDIDPDKQKNYVAFAAGSGITPIISIIKTHLALEPNSTFKLFYVNQAVSTIILREELEGLKNRYLERFEIFHFLTQEQRSVPLFNGRIDREKLDILFKTLIDADSTDDIFLCGPSAMIFLIRDYLEEIGFDKKQIHFELFNSDDLPRNPKARQPRKVDDNVLTEVNIREGGKIFQFNIPKGSDNILDAALKQNADLPFACKGGVCCTCRAKLVEGEVEVLVNYGLEQEEIDEGFILTCQSVPISDKVSVDFDAAVSKY